MGQTQPNTNGAFNKTKQTLLTRYIKTGNRQKIYDLDGNPAFSNRELKLALALIDFNEGKYGEAAQKLVAFIEGKGASKPSHEILTVYCACADKSLSPNQRKSRLGFKTDYNELLMNAKTLLKISRQTTSKGFSSSDTAGAHIGTNRIVYCPCKN